MSTANGTSRITSFSLRGWHIFEWKVDGVRCIMHYNSGKVQLQSKTGKDFTRQFPELWTPQVNAREAILDGEVTVFTEGKPDFEATMERYMVKPKNVTGMIGTIKSQHYANMWLFTIMHLMDAWRASDIVTELPPIEIEAIGITDLDWFIENQLSLEQA